MLAPLQTTINQQLAIPTRQKHGLFRYTSIDGWLWRPVGSALGQRETEQPDFTNLPIWHAPTPYSWWPLPGYFTRIPSVFLSCLHIKTVGSCWLLVVGCLAPNNQQLPTVRIKCNKKEIANDTLRVLAPNHRASVPSAQVFAIPIFNIQKHAEIVKKKWPQRITSIP